MAFSPIDQKEYLKIPNNFLFAQLSFPSLGIIMSSSLVPVKILMLQFLMSINNNFSFLKFSRPGISGSTAFMDFTNSAYDLSHINDSLYKISVSFIKKGKPETSDDAIKNGLEKPLLYNYLHRKEPSVFTNEEIDGIIESIQSVIEKNQLKCLVIHGISGFCHESMLQFITKLKNCIVYNERYSCLIIVSMIGDVNFSNQNNFGNFSYIPLHACHNDSVASADWLWTIAETNIKTIEMLYGGNTIRQSGDLADPSMYFANKIFTQTNSLSLTTQRPVESMFKNFFIVKKSPPIMYAVQLSS